MMNKMTKDNERKIHWWDAFVTLFLVLILGFGIGWICSQNDIRDAFTQEEEKEELVGLTTTTSISMWKRVWEPIPEVRPLKHDCNKLCSLCYNNSNYGYAYDDSSSVYGGLWIECTCYYLDKQEYDGITVCSIPSLLGYVYSISAEKRFVDPFEDIPWFVFQPTFNNFSSVNYLSYVNLTNLIGSPYYDGGMNLNFNNNSTGEGVE